MSMIDPELLCKLHKPVPRYTSYPTAPHWTDFTPSLYEETLHRVREPLSLYCHVPFCESMCLYCGCSVILNRRPENEQRYVNYLQKEIALIAAKLSEKLPVKQLHFGGGTPTKLTCEQLTALMETLSHHFDLSGELAIEIDPRTVVQDQGHKLRHLKQLGFNRVSFGVQDTNSRVQAAVRRFQTLEMTESTYRLARELGFEGINMDLIYGLPHQTVASFRETIHHMLALRPDRLSLFSYAKVPWLKPHQKAIKEALLPSMEEKFQIYTLARQAFIEAGYVAIGMDHFSLPDDELAIAYRNHTLSRNFQGYTVEKASHLIGLGVTAIGKVGSCYVQNVKELPVYYDLLDQGLLPVAKGKTLSEDDLIRRWVIQKLMCRFALDKREFEQHFRIPFDLYFAEVSLKALEEDRLLICYPTHLQVTPLGELFVRNIATHFDAYVKPTETRFSASI